MHSYAQTTAALSAISRGTSLVCRSCQSILARITFPGIMKTKMYTGREYDNIATEKRLSIR